MNPRNFGQLLVEELEDGAAEPTADRAFLHRDHQIVARRLPQDKIAVERFEKARVHDRRLQTLAAQALGRLQGDAGPCAQTQQQNVLPLVQDLPRTQRQ